jgi:cell division protein FtsL
MIRINVLLLVAVVLSALYLVHTQYESRRLFVEIEKAALQMRKLEMDSESALAEKRAQATPMRVDKLAKEKLKMQPATPAITQNVALRDSAAPPAPVKP